LTSHNHRPGWSKKARRERGYGAEFTVLSLVRPGTIRRSAHYRGRIIAGQRDTG
jgi:hypothetical protein